MSTKITQAPNKTQTTKFDDRHHPWAVGRGQRGRGSALGRSEMLPAWVADVIAAGTEDGPALEQAVLELQNSPLVKKVEKLADGSGIYATLWCIAEHRRRPSEQRQFSAARERG